YSKTGVFCLHLKQTRSHRLSFLTYRLRLQIRTPVGIRPMSRSFRRREQKKRCSQHHAFEQRHTLQHLLSIPSVFSRTRHDLRPVNEGELVGEGETERPVFPQT